MGQSSADQVQFCECHLLSGPVRSGGRGCHLIDEKLRLRDVQRQLVLTEHLQNNPEASILACYHHCGCLMACSDPSSLAVIHNSQQRASVHPGV